ncbi:M15 family metallopeptidase [Allomuricauda sp. SCSIO 65647]|uniref:M15 family metallopeptidase n=1 Tax=Allomuricauda sp. SCSIO 65647 TaxID=2908843 RepID=UPI001F29F15F|nr:M15 family metallopeptidase [Muricauda sp. SCSIO 65647]UJH66979.1 M15 family metallopeptidase [Muricauda sp. SCSIO 65647]
MIDLRMGAVFLLCALIIGCKQQKQTEIETTVKDTVSIKMMDTTVSKPTPSLQSFEGLADTTFVRLADFSNDFAYDMRYATENNFLKAKVYDCAECYVRVKTAKALITVNRKFLEEGYKIKFFDCYRPNSVQYKMWELVPNPQYVANPVKGSIHNKGGAVDITLVDIDGNELDMGTDFDFFGHKAHHDYTDLPEEVLANRKLLKETMEKHGFWSIRTEWWHYNLSAGSNDKVANFKWDCPLP